MLVSSSQQTNNNFMPKERVIADVLKKAKNVLMIYKSKQQQNADGGVKVIKIKDYKVIQI